jgi:hypothetical protein
MGKRNNNTIERNIDAEGKPSADMDVDVRVFELQIQVEQIGGVASITAETMRLSVSLNARFNSPGHVPGSFFATMVPLVQTKLESPSYETYEYLGAERRQKHGC